MLVLVSSLQQQAFKKHKIRGRQRSYNTGLGTVLQHIGLYRSNQKSYITDRDKVYDSTVEVFVASMSFVPRDMRLGYKISSSFLQTITAEESLSRVPTLTFCRMVASNSEVFSLVQKGDLTGLLSLLQDGQAALTDCDEEGRSLLTVSEFIS